MPITTVSEANSREYWAKKALRHKRQKHQIAMKFLVNPPKLSLPISVRMIRISRGALDDDNLRSALKYVRDEIANQFIPGKRAGMSDSDPRIQWEYAQIKEKGLKNKETKLRLEFIKE